MIIDASTLLGRDNEFDQEVSVAFKVLTTTDILNLNLCFHLSLILKQGVDSNYRNLRFR